MAGALFKCVLSLLCPLSISFVGHSSFQSPNCGLWRQIELVLNPVSARE